MALAQQRHAALHAAGGGEQQPEQAQPHLRQLANLRQGSFTVPETVAPLGRSESTVVREGRFVRAWLRQELRDRPEPAACVLRGHEARAVDRAARSSRFCPRSACANLLPGMRRHRPRSSLQLVASR